MPPQDDNAESAELEAFQKQFEERFYAAQQLVDSWVPASVKENVSAQGRVIQGRAPRLGIGAHRKETDVAKQEGDVALRRQLLGKKGKQAASNQQTLSKNDPDESDDSEESRASTIKAKKGNVKTVDAFSKSKARQSSFALKNSPSVESTSSQHTTPSASVVSTVTSNASPEPVSQTSRIAPDTISLFASTSAVPLPWDMPAPSRKGKEREISPDNDEEATESWMEIVAEAEEQERLDTASNKQRSPRRGPYRILFDGEVAETNDDTLLALHPVSQRKGADESTTPTHEIDPSTSTTKKKRNRKRKRQREE